MKKAQKAQKNKTRDDRFKPTTLPGVLAMFMLTVSLFISLPVSAGPIKKNDQTLMVQTNEQGCATHVVLASPDDNCAGSEFADTCGKNGKDCVCMRTGKFVTWEVDNGSRFEIKLRDADPFTANCSLKSKNKPRIKCKVATDKDGEYEYDLILETCPGQVYDPVIVIRK
jgi:hypothetical protein